MKTKKVLKAIAAERARQKEIGEDGVFTSTNDLIATALAYIGRASTGVRRNECGIEERRSMLVKGCAVLVDAVERMGECEPRPDDDEPDTSQPPLGYTILNEGYNPLLAFKDKS